MSISLAVCCVASLTDVLESDHSTASLVTFIITATTLGLLLPLWQIQRPQKRYLHAATVVATGRPPVLTLPENKKYHIFLSHTCALLLHLAHTCPRAFADLCAVDTRNSP